MAMKKLPVQEEIIPKWNHGPDQHLKSRKKLKHLKSIFIESGEYEEAKASSISAKTMIWQPTTRNLELACPRFPFFTLCGKKRFKFITRTTDMPFCGTKKMEVAFRVLPPLRQVEYARPTPISFPEEPEEPRRKEPRIVIFPPIIKKMPTPCSERISLLGEPAKNWRELRKKELEDERKIYMVSSAALQAQATERLKQLSKPRLRPVQNTHRSEGMSKAIPPKSRTESTQKKRCKFKQKQNMISEKEQTSYIKKEIDDQQRKESEQQEKKETEEQREERKRKEMKELHEIIKHHDIAPPPPINSPFPRTLSYVLLPALSSDAARHLDMITKREEEDSKPCVDEETPPAKEKLMVIAEYPESLPTIGSSLTKEISKTSVQHEKIESAETSSDPENTTEEDKTEGTDTSNNHTISGSEKEIEDQGTSDSSHPS